MSKKNVNISIEAYTHEEAKKRNLNVSEICERALVKKLTPENEIDNKGDKCEYCNREMKKATANNMDGLYWFLPDEKWICPSCEKIFVDKIVNTIEGEKKIVSTLTEDKRKELIQEARDFVNLCKKEILEQIKNKEPFE